MPGRQGAAPPDIWGGMASLHAAFLPPPPPHTGIISKVMDVVPGRPRLHFYDNNDIVSDWLKGGRVWEQVWEQGVGAGNTGCISWTWASWVHG